MTRSRCSLHEAAVQRGGVVAAAGQGFREVVHLQPRPGEDEDRCGPFDVQDPGQRGQLVAARHDVSDLPHERRALARRALAHHGDAHRVAEVTRRDPTDCRRDRRREQRGLPLGRGLVQDGFEVLGEAHVEHLVRLVQHDRAHSVESQRAALQVVDGPPRSGDHDVDSPPQPPELLTDRLSAVHRQHARLQPAPVPMNRLGHLHRQLSRRHQHEGARRAIVAPLEPLQHRRRERRRLAFPVGASASRSRPASSGGIASR
jgi:hypothetical protein